MALFVERDDPDALTAQQIVDQLGSFIAARYQAAETYLLAQIAQRAAADLDVDDQTRRLASVRALRAEAERVMGAIDSETLARQVVNLAVAEGSSAAVEQIGLTAAAAGSSTTAVLNGQALPFATGLTSAGANAAAQIGLELTNALADVRQRVLRAVPDLYQQVVAETVGERLLGTVTGRQSRRIGLERALDRGLTGFTDAAGRRWRMGSYTEMATRTATNRAWIAAHVTKWQSMGLNLVTIVRGVDACKPCAEWSGRILSTDGTPAGPLQAEHATTGEPVTVDVAGTLDDARRGGWNHPNCRCTLAPVFPGLSLPANDSTYDPQQEADRERLRYLERRTRDLKRREQVARALGDDVAAARWKRAVQVEQGRIRDHVASTGQLRKPYREALSFADGAPRTLPPTPPTPIVPDVPPVAPAAASSDVPAWLAEHRAITARLPERDTIGRATRTITPDEARALEVTRLEGLYLNGQNAKAAAEQLDAMQDRLDAFTALRNARLERAELTTATTWPDDLRDLARRAGVARRQPRTITLGTLEDAITQQGAVRMKLEMGLDRYDTALEQRDIRGWVARETIVDDLAPGGGLGQATAQALDDVLAAGRVVDDEIERRLALAVGGPADIDGEVYDAARARLSGLQSEYYRELTRGSIAKADELKAEIDRLTVDVREMYARRIAYENWVTENRRRVTLEVLGEIRDYGGGARSTYTVTRGPARAMRASLERAHQNYPTEWNDRVAALFPDVEVMLSPRGSNTNGVILKLSNHNKVGFDRIATHELGHSMERVPGVRGLEWAYHYRRSDKITDAAGIEQRAPARHLGAGYDKGEVHVPDQWANDYIGKVYDRGQIGADSSWEVFTMGAESLFDGSPYLDSEYRRWLLGVLSSV